MNRHLIAAAAVAAIVAVAPLAASAQLAPGTTLSGTLDQNLNSKDAQIGQTITISNAHSPNHDINGAVIYGHVDNVRRAGQGTPGKIHLTFDKVNTRSGNIYQIEGYASNMQVTTKSNSTKEIASTAGGALVGGLLGHGLGAVLGAGAGYAISKNSRENVSIAQGSLVTVQITQSRRQGT
jgi:hypothetical protein